MNIYFAGSITGGRDDRAAYEQILTLLRQHGTVLTEHVGSIDLTETGEVGLSDEEIYQRDITWLDQADVLVAEVSTPSLGVGYELGRAEGKPILCLYREQPGKRLSAMIRGNKNVLVRTYRTINEVSHYLKEFLDSSTLRP